MSEQRTREKWIDEVKAFACILVVLGHFFQSMVKSEILPDGNVYEWFNTTIYYFHVPLFFICSGYLYQKYSKVNNFDSWKKNIVKKAVSLGIPYLTFTIITWLLKTMFSSDTNDQIDSLWRILFIHPIAPYWYLYALFFIFLVTPTFTNEKMAGIGLTIALIAKIFVSIQNIEIYVISTVFTNEIWFVLGMYICASHIHIKGKSQFGIILSILFLGLSVALYMADIQNPVVSFVLGLIACTAVITLAADSEKKTVVSHLSKYTMPIFLMHTLFAAPLRIMLLKMGIRNAVVHIFGGLVISFMGPIVVTLGIEKIKWMKFFIYPNKVIENQSKNEKSV